LMRWLSTIAQLEADKSYKPTTDDVSLIKSIARFYHKLVPIQKTVVEQRKHHSVFIANPGLEKDIYASLIDLHLRENGVTVFFDRAAVPTGADGLDRIMAAACSCKYLWCVLSKNFLKSRYALGELMIGYIRYMTEGPESFCLILDCLETEYSRGEWMNQVLHEMDSLKLYRENGEIHRFPASIRAKTDENVLERIRRIASSELADGCVLVPWEASEHPLARASNFLGQSIALYRAARDEADQHTGPNLDPLIAVSYTHLRAHETVLDLVCRLLLEKKKIFAPIHRT